MDLVLMCLVVVLTYAYLKSNPKAMNVLRGWISYLGNIRSKKKSDTNTEQIVGKYPFGCYISKYSKTGTMVVSSKLSYPPCKTIEKIFGVGDCLVGVSAVCSVIKAEDNCYLHKWKLFVDDSHTCVVNEFLIEIQKAYREE